MRMMSHAEVVLWDAILDAVWMWEVSRYGKPANKFSGRVLFEACMAHIEG